MTTTSLLWNIVGLPWHLLRGCWRGLGKILRSAWFWIPFLLALLVLLVCYYGLANRYTPYTSEAYIQAYVVQVAPRVEGQVIAVHVRENQRVTKGTLLFEIDPRPFEHKVRQLEASLELMTQQVAQLESELTAARADEARLQAEEIYALAVHKQEDEIFKKGSTTERRYLDAVQKRQIARAALDRARAVVRQKEQALAARVGNEHALIAEVGAQLASARLYQEWTQVFAPANGYITNLQLQPGTSVPANRPVLTCIDDGQWWIVANFRENNLEYLQTGQSAGITFRSYPGRIFPGTVQSVGWGVGQGQGVPSGELPDVKSKQDWVTLPQRFQVRLALDNPGDIAHRVGATASVTVFVTDSAPLKPVAEAWEWLETWFSYLR